MEPFKKWPYLSTDLKKDAALDTDEWHIVACYAEIDRLQALTPKPSKRYSMGLNGTNGRPELFEDAEGTLMLVENLTPKPAEDAGRLKLVEALKAKRFRMRIKDGMGFERSDDQNGNYLYWADFIVALAGEAL